MAGEERYKVLPADDPSIANFDGSEMTTGAGFADPTQAERRYGRCLPSRHVEWGIAAVDVLVFD